jgi:hypothetical protein
MSDIAWARAATLDRIGDVVEDIAGVHLCDLPPSTTLLVRTMNSLYRIVIAHWPEVYVQGGAFFPDLTAAYLDGASLGGNCLKVGWIGVGLLVEIRSGGRRILTSRVRAIVTDQTSCSAVQRSAAEVDQ